MGNIIEINKGNFNKEVLKSNLPVLVDYWAQWCMPCKTMAPIIEEIAKEYSNKIKVAKVNVDEDATLATKYGITSIPTFLFFKDGKEISRIVGVVPKKKLVDKIKELE
jgi:thioredoxin 1